MALLIIHGPQAFADETIEQLLEQVDQTLNKQPSSNRGRDSNEDAPPRPQRAPRTTPQVSEEKIETPKPPEPLSTPNLFQMPDETASLQRVDAPRSSRVIAGVSKRRLQGVSRLEKDDDIFTLDGKQTVSGIALNIDHQLTQVPVSGAYAIGILVGGGVSMYRGELAVKRRGIINQDIHVDMTLVPWHASVGARFPTNSRLFIETGYQVIIEAINQSGQGVTDTVSDVLPADAAVISVGFKLGERFTGLLSWHQRGVLLTSDSSSIPGDSASFALGAYL